MGFLNNFFKNKKQVSEYQPEWNFYTFTEDDTLTSIATDLNLKTIAPINEQDYAITVSIKIICPYDNGVANNEEAEILWNIEDEIFALLDNDHINYSFVGRFTSNGFRDLYFYAANAPLVEKLITSALSSFPDYTFSLSHKLDNEWSTYFNFLHPTPMQIRIIHNKAVLEQLEKGGDDLTKEREVFHWIYFHTENNLKQFEEYALTQNFKIASRGKEDNSDEFQYMISISRVDKVSYNEINEYTLVLWNKAKELNGLYDGWETSIEK